MSGEALENLEAIKDCPAETRVTFRARVLRLWEVGGLRMCLVGDASALIRVEVEEAVVEQGESYEFANALVREYPGGWHSVALDEESRIRLVDFDVEVSQDEGYIELTFKILSGVQRKKGRAAGRLPPWRHQAFRDGEDE
jgi:hypothetical protein